MLGLQRFRAMSIHPMATSGGRHRHRLATQIHTQPPSQHHNQAWLRNTQGIKTRTTIALRKCRVVKRNPPITNRLTWGLSIHLHRNSNKTYPPLPINPREATTKATIHLTERGRLGRRRFVPSHPIRVDSASLGMTIPIGEDTTKDTAAASISVRWVASNKMYLTFVRRNAVTFLAIHSRLTRSHRLTFARFTRKASSSNSSSSSTCNSIRTTIKVVGMLLWGLGTLK